jgi:hypothetical protein
MFYLFQISTCHFESSETKDDENEESDIPFVKDYSLVSNKAGKLCINVRGCQHHIMRYVSEYFDYRDCVRFYHFRIIWTDSHPTFDTLSRLKDSHHLSRFPLFNELSRKEILFLQIVFESG